MCMTSKQPVNGFSSALPYSEEALPTHACQLASCQAAPPVGQVSPSVLSVSSTSVVPASPTTLSPVASPSTASNITRSKQTEICLSTQISRRLIARKRHPASSKRELPPSLQNRSCKTPNQRFAAFVAILLLQLEGTVAMSGGPKKNYKLYLQTKALVAECCRRHQLGDTHFSPLSDSMSERLRGLVGTSHWNRSLVHLQGYLVRYHQFHLKHATAEDQKLLQLPTKPLQQK